MSTAAPATSVPTERPRLPRRRWLMWCSAAMCVLSWLLHIAQPAPLAWLMIFPRWTWLIAGMGMLFVGYVKPQWKWSLLVFLFWDLYTAFNVLESRSIAKSLFERPRPVPAGKTSFRVISFNCGSDSSDAAREAFDLKPDLIAYQESPQRETLQKLASAQWGTEGSVVWGPDASIVARGRLTLGQRSPKGTWIWATWHRAEGDIEVVSLRLSPVPLRFDCWSPDCWRAMTLLRETHRAEIAELIAALGDKSESQRCIIIGDFNAPAHDASLGELRVLYRDSFDEAGFGWGNTIMNGFPVQRIDQVWINPSLEALRVQAIRSQHSDHTLVISDLFVR